MLINLGKSLLILCVFPFFATGANAQEQPPQKWYGLLQQGIVFNNGEVNVQPAVAGGWQWKGLGAGLQFAADFMTVRSFQTAIDLRKSFTLGRQRFVFFAAPGLNRVIPSKKDKEESGFYTDHRFKNGKYFEAGGGIFIGKEKKLFAAFYWSRKTYSETYKNFLWNPVLQRMEDSEVRNSYEFNRLGFKVGWMF